jgi:poly(glycerol-phosphate) alpha-glucosyltransferase
MRIVFVTGSISRAAGGLFDGVRRLAQSVAEREKEVRVFGLEDAWSAADASLWKPVEARLFRTVGHRGFGFAPRLARELLVSKADVVCSHGLWRYTSVAVHAWHRKTLLPYIVHPHGMLDEWAVRNSRWKKRLASICYEAAHLRDAACICALCEAEAGAIRRYGLRNPIAIIPNGMDVPGNGDFRAWGREGVEALERESVRVSGRGQRVLLFLGRIHPKKGLVNLLKAWKEVGVRDWVLAIAGWDDGGHEAELKRLCAELGVNGRGEGGERRGEKGEGRRERGSSVVFLGPQFGEAKAECCRRCDAFILPSVSEGLPMAVLEAWSYGKPVLMTPECNLPEGFVANAALRIGTDLRGIACGLNELVRMSSAELAGMGQRGLALVRTRFNWKDIGAQMQALSAWITGNGPRPDCVPG